MDRIDVDRTEYAVEIARALGINISLEEASIMLELLEIGMSPENLKMLLEDIKTEKKNDVLSALGMVHPK